MLILATTAFAGPPAMLHADELARARRRVEADLGIETVRQVTATELITSSETHFVRAERIEQCTGEPTDNARILRLIGEAEELRLTMRPDLARATLLQGASAWACLGEPADATLGARLYFLLGVVAFAVGDPLAAADAFRVALRSDPDLAWDRDTAPDAREVFERVRAERSYEPVTVTLVPHDAELALRIDGRSVAPLEGQLTVSRGPHLVQLALGDRAQSLWVWIDDDDWLILSQQVDDSLVREIDEPRARRSVEGLVEAAGLERPVVAPGRRSTWTLDESWIETRPPFVRRARLPMSAAGAALLLGGGLWLSREARMARGRLNELQTGGLDSDAYDLLVRDHATGRTRHSVALGVAGVGVGILGAGGLMWVATW
ncbi:MAG: hypothetical protein KTR31_29100 [Myxococcales bacterium]|nr:hypothetical protein [Myxococcales bacterium]